MPNYLPSPLASDKKYNPYSLNGRFWFRTKMGKIHQNYLFLQKKTSVKGVWTVFLFLSEASGDRRELGMKSILTC